MKKTIKLNEATLKNVINSVLMEAFKSDILRKAAKEHGGIQHDNTFRAADLEDDDLSDERPEGFNGSTIGFNDGTKMYSKKHYDGDKFNQRYKNSIARDGHEKYIWKDQYAKKLFNISREWDEMGDSGKRLKEMAKKAISDLKRHNNSYNEFRDRLRELMSAMGYGNHATLNDNGANSKEGEQMMEYIYYYMICSKTIYPSFGSEYEQSLPARMRDMTNESKRRHKKNK